MLPSPFASPSSSGVDRRMRLGSEGLNLSDNDMLFPCSQSIYSSSQLDSLFSAGPGSSSHAGDAAQAGGPVLPPIVHQEPAPVPSSSSIEPLLGRPKGMKRFGFSSVLTANPIKKQCRSCCFLFQEWPHDIATTVSSIGAIVQRLVVLKEKAHGQGVSLEKQPTFFFNKTGPGVWLVLTSVSTFVSKWDQVAQTIGSNCHRPVVRPEGTSPACDGFQRIAAMFNMTTEETQQLMVNRLTGLTLPQALFFIGIVCCLCLVRKQRGSASDAFVFAGQTAVQDPARGGGGGG
jgi:hypothetical protein